MIVGVVARQARRHLVERELRQDGDAVERFLTMYGDIISQGLQGLAREGVIDAFGFLEAYDMWLACRQPGDERVDALLDGVDVPGGDQHGEDTDGRRDHSLPQRSGEEEEFAFPYGVPQGTRGYAWRPQYDRSLARMRRGGIEIRG